MTDYGAFIAFLFGLYLLWMAVCWLIERISNRIDERKAERERLKWLESEYERLSSEVRYLEYINKVTVLCKNFIK